MRDIFTALVVGVGADTKREETKRVRSHGYRGVRTSGTCDKLSIQHSNSFMRLTLCHTHLESNIPQGCNGRDQQRAIERYPDAAANQQLLPFYLGLCSDFGLIVMFVRMYTATKKQLDSFGDRDRHDAQLAKAQEEADRLSQEQHHASSSSSRHASPSGPASPLPTTAQSHSSHSSHNPLHHLQSGWKKFVALAPTLNSDSEHTPGTPNGNGAAHAISHPSPEHRFAGEPAQTIVTLNTTTTSNGLNSGISKVSIVALNQDESIWGVQWRNPDQLWLLIAASIFHVVGNCVTTIWATSIHAMAVFHISYGLSFPLYAYYLYVDNHALRQTKVYMPAFSKIKTFTSACLSLVGATATVRLGLYVATRAANHVMEAL